MAEQEFNAAELLKLGEKKLTVRLGECSAAQLRELIAAERAQGATARSGVLKVLAAELDARAAELTPESVEAIAKACHTMNATYCAAIGDASQLPWDDAPEWQRESAIKGVALHLGNPDASPAASHEGWMSEKVADGWVFGEVKDPEKKTHPCIVPFDELPVEQQAKDYLFKQTVHILAPIFDQIEALSAQLDAAPERETVGPGSAAEKVPQMDDAAQGKLLEKVVELAFCEGDEVRFKIPATAADFEPQLGIARYVPRTVLARRKPKVRIDTVVALDEVGKPLARRKWPTALSGGGGTEGVFPPRSISFEL